MRKSTTLSSLWNRVSWGGPMTLPRMKDKRYEVLQIVTALLSCELYQILS